MYRLGTVYIDNSGDVVYVPDRTRPPFTAETPMELKAMLVNAVLKVVKQKEGVRILVLASDFKKRRTTKNATRQSVASSHRTQRGGARAGGGIRKRVGSRRKVSRG